MAAPINLALAMNLPPERAVEYFTAKGMRITSGWRDIEAAAHARAFTVAGVLKAEALQDIRDALDEALTQGTTFDQFVKTLKPKLKAKGWWGIAHDPETGEVLQGRAMTPHRLRPVYQTNLQSAYMAGRYKAQLEDADQRPYWQYVAILDSRTRPRHRSLNGRIFRFDDPIWRYIYPPNGYRCRCRVVALSHAEFLAAGGLLSEGKDHIETVILDLGPRGGKVPVTGYRDPATKEFFGPDGGFDSNPGQGAFGLDIALARRTQQLKTPEIRRQVWQALNNSPLRQAEYRNWVRQTLAQGTPGHTAQVVGFVTDEIAGFAAQHQPEAPPIRVAAINEKRLVHADSAKHIDGGIALNADQYQALPGIIAQPDAVYFDTAHNNLVYVRDLADGEAIYVALNPAENVKRVGEIDALVNAYRLPATADGAGRLRNRKRYFKMGE